MNRPMQLLKKITTKALRLLLSPVIGSVSKIKAEANRPRAATWQEFILNDIRLYFAPFTGAIEGVKSELHKQKSP